MVRAGRVREHSPPALPVGSPTFRRHQLLTLPSSAPGSASRSPSLASSASVGESLSEEELVRILEQLEDKKKLIATVRSKPWPMAKKLTELR